MPQKAVQRKWRETDIRCKCQAVPCTGKRMSAESLVMPEVAVNGKNPVFGSFMLCQSGKEGA